MHNLVYLIGRLTENPEVKEYDGSKAVTINLAVQRSYKNADGVYEADFLRCILWNAIAENTAEYCHKGDLIGIKGRLQTRKYEDENKETKYITEVFVDRVSFLASKRDSKEEEI